MKKVICILLAMSMLLFSGCSGSLLTTHKSLPVDAKGLQSLTIFTMNSFVVDDTTGANRYLQTDQSANTKWNQEMMNRYGIPVMIYCPFDVHTDLTSENSSKSLIDGFYNGDKNSSVFYMDDDSILKYMKLGDLLPLDDYVKDNATWIALPDTIKSQYTYNGHVWAIPAQLEKPTASQLYVRNDWLTVTGKSIPTSTDELFALGQAKKSATPGDPQNNYLFRSLDLMLPDIFNAFGLYFTNDWETKDPIGYDPKLNCFADPFFKPEAKSALEYLRSMYTSGMMDPDSFTQSTMGTNKTAYSKKTGAVQGTLGSISEINDNWLKNSVSAFNPQDASDQNLNLISNFLQPLPPLSTKYVKLYTLTSGGAYVLPKGTPKPKETINFFLDMVYGSPQNMLDCAYGPDNYKLSSDKTIELTNSAANIAYPNLVKPDSTILNEYHFNDATQKIDARFASDENAYISRYTATGQLKKMSVFDITSYGNEYDIYRYKMIAAQKLLIQSAVMYGHIDQALAIYRRTVMGGCNLQQVLQEINTNAGKNNAETLFMPDFDETLG